MEGRDPTETGDDDATYPHLESLEAGVEALPELVEPSEVLRYLDDAEQGPGYDESLPGILKMPEGMKVDERRVGRAVAQWVLHVRCDCGKRWFETDVVDSTTCPRCGLLVYVDMDARRRR
ncbi:MAG: hypothetical protein U1F08_07815 [Steroidobacteraceae bacterium]